MYRESACISNLRSFLSADCSPSVFLPLWNVSFCLFSEAVSRRSMYTTLWYLVKNAPKFRRDRSVVFEMYFGARRA